MNDRIRLLRKTLNLSQEEFGKKVGVSNTAISKIEKAERNLTEQMILSICREFRVNYFWLIEGKGEMFSGTPETVIDELAEEYNLDNLDRKIIEKYLSLNEDNRMVIKEYLKSIFT
ncbi:XRE family transcriptional regulator [Lachnospiraceae bacterium TF09-5]|nr:XRE family transcriptional regulator [Lachnospiraceae bacterium TF09-5]